MYFQGEVKEYGEEKNRGEKVIREELLGRNCTGQKVQFRPEF